MHSYSIDRDLRVKVSIYIFIISILISVILNDFLGDRINNVMTLLNNGKARNIIKIMEWLDINQNILGVMFWYGILMWFYNDVAWKWKCFNVLHGIPNLNGEWEGNLKSSYNEKEIPMKMKVIQTWSKISIQTEFTETKSLSSSNVAAIYVDGNKGTQIYFGYTNDSYDVSSKMQTHAGYNILTLLEDNKIKARYFNDRPNPNPKIKGGNKGTFELTKKDV